MKSLLSASIALSCSMCTHRVRIFYTNSVPPIECVMCDAYLVHVIAVFTSDCMLISIIYPQAGQSQKTCNIFRGPSMVIAKTHSNS